MGLHFLAFWPCGHSFPCILAFSGSASGPPPTSCQKWPVCPTSLQRIYQGRDRLHFAVFSFSLLGLHFLAFWHCGPSFPCILALWVFISLRFGLLGFHFLLFWPCGPSFPCILASSGSPTSCQKWPVCPTSLQWIYQGRDRLHFAVFSLLGLFGRSFPFLLAFWAFISFYIGILGLHFLSFWPFGPLFPFILAFWAFISFHFGFLGLYFVAFWRFGASFPFIFAVSLWFSGPWVSFLFVSRAWISVPFGFLAALSATLSAYFGFHGFDGSPGHGRPGTCLRNVRDGQPLPTTMVGRCCRGVPRPGPRLTQGGVVWSDPHRLTRSVLEHLAAKEESSKILLVSGNITRRLATLQTG